MNAYLTNELSRAFNEENLRILSELRELKFENLFHSALTLLLFSVFIGL